MRLSPLIALIALAASGVRASPPAEGSAHALALAAGYKAAFLCSGLFDAGEPESEIAADDLEGVYPQYQSAVRTLTARVDSAAKTVSVAFDEHLPPRIAAWRPWLGCTQLPIGAPPETAAALPRLEGVTPVNTDTLPWPAGDRGALAPAGADADTATLEATLAKAFDHASYGVGTETTAVIVANRGHILAERYRAGFDEHRPQRTWSAAKSLTATLIGRAVQLKLAKIDAPVDIPEWSRPGDPRAQIMLAQLMHMASGLWTDGPGNRTDEVYLGGAAVTQVPTAMPIEAAPGNRFRYANNDALLAARSLRATLGGGERALAFPFTQLLWRIGMTHTTLETDWQGNFVLSSQVWTTARDLARLSLLYLDDGVWEGQRLLPEGWSRFVATPAPAQPEGAANGPGYGAFFWLYGARQGLPEGTYAMEGNRGQYVFIVPARGIVIVRRGFDAAGKPPFDAAGFVRDVLTAMR
jgi:CubicO group peptidase (beta-lactamase class C family)